MRVHYKDVDVDESSSADAAGYRLSACGKEGNLKLTSDVSQVDCKSCLRCIAGAQNGGMGVTCLSLRPVRPRMPPVGQVPKDPAMWDRAHP